MVRPGGILYLAKENGRLLSLPLLSLLFLLFIPCGSLAGSDGELPLHTIKLPPGFTISVYASNVPNGVAFRDGALYMAAVNRVLRFDDIENQLNNPPQSVVVNDSFPRDRSHR